MAQGQQPRLPRVVVNEDEKQEEEEREKRQAVFTYTLGMAYGEKGEGLPRELFTELCELMVPRWDTGEQQQQQHYVPPLPKGMMLCVCEVQGDGKLGLRVMELEREREEKDGRAGEEDAGEGDATESPCLLWWSPGLACVLAPLPWNSLFLSSVGCRPLPVCVEMI